MRKKTILYLTDSQLDEHLAHKCREYLLKAAGDIPIVSVSQKPLDFGVKNVCVGLQPRCWNSFYEAQLAGLEIIETPVVAIAEHDCLYTSEHFAFDPPDLEVFYYNTNVWLAQWSDTNHPELKGMFSYWHKRTAFSQLIVGRDICLSAGKDRNQLIKESLVNEDRYSKRLRELSFSLDWRRRSHHLSGTLKHWRKKWEKEKMWETEIPNLDIRHGNNFSGPRRGYRRCYELPYWGKLEDILK